jgi:hypothetical protein
MALLSCPRLLLPGRAGCWPRRAGLYGSSKALSSAACTGPCSAGYYCEAGSSIATAAPCPPGTYSVGGADDCTPCPVGRYGLATSMTSSLCSGPCPAGRYGSTPGLSSSQCSGTLLLFAVHALQTPPSTASPPFSHGHTWISGSDVNSFCCYGFVYLLDSCSCLRSLIKVHLHLHSHLHVHFRVRNLVRAVRRWLLRPHRRDDCVDVHRALPPWIRLRGGVHASEHRSLHLGDLQHRRGFHLHTMPSRSVGTVPQRLLGP